VTLKKFKKKNTTEENNALEEDKIGGTTLFLKIIGIPPNIKVSYDTKAVREKIKERLKDETTEIKKLFQKRNIYEEQKKQPKVQVDENNIIDLDE
jgi:flagellar capping protein FliD